MTTQNNPFLKISKRPFETFDFDSLKTEHFIPALHDGIEKARAKIEIIKNVSQPTFENTIVALELSSPEVGMVSKIFHNLLSAHRTDELQALSDTVSTELVKFSSDMSLDPVLFQKIKAVFDSKPTELSVEQNTLLEKTYKSFSRNGALLDNAKKDKLRKIDEELSLLAIKFGENTLKATNAFELVVENISELVGVPAGSIQAASELAKSKNLDGKWIFNLQAPSFMPVISYAKNRAIREKLYFALNTRCIDGEYSNQEVIKKTVDLRAKRAQLLGYKTHAHFTLEERMAKDPETVTHFLSQFVEAGMEKAREEKDKLVVLMGEVYPGQEMKPWDMSYLSEILKMRELDFDEESVRPFFKLENVIQGVFDITSKLYGIKFLERTDIPVYHPDVKTFEVLDSKTNKTQAIFYCEFFPRETKSGGAWMTSFQEHHVLDGQEKIPQTSIVCNFIKPTSTQPSLLNLNEVRTLFHEFGHALHGMLSKCEYESLAGPNVFWDFVELPSQIFENWVLEKDALDLFAKHYQTGETMPTSMIEKIKKASKFMGATMTMRQIRFSILDMAWHTLDGVSDLAGKSVLEFEEKILKPLAVIETPKNINNSVAFGHIFKGGYSAGYYSYKWAEVLDADAFELFKQNGIFDAKTATRFKDEILARGGSEHPSVLYKRFRGSAPSIEPLLRRSF